MSDSGITNRKIYNIDKCYCLCPFLWSKTWCSQHKKLWLSPIVVMHVAKYCPMQSMSGMMLNELMQGNFEGRQRYNYNGNI